MKTLYKNKDWLQRKYVDEKLGDLQIAKLLKSSVNTIGNWRKKFGIDSRPHNIATHLAKANHCSLSQEALEWINGELLGDGCLHSYSDYSAKIYYSSSKDKYLKYISKTLNSFGIKQCGKINKKYYKEFECYCYLYNSLCYTELLPLRLKWYPHGKKIVPRDIKLTPITCRQWYIGDGCLDCFGKSPCIFLCTCGFSISDVEFLKEKLIKLGFKTTRQPYCNRIHISTKSVWAFLKYIGPCPVKCYQYKWYYDKKLKKVS